MTTAATGADDVAPVAGSEATASSVIGTYDFGTFKASVANVEHGADRYCNYRR